VGALAGEGCRDAEGNFVPVPQCTGRMKPKEPKAKKAEPKPGVEFYKNKHPEDIEQIIEVDKSRRKTVKKGYAKGVHYMVTYPASGFETWMSAKNLKAGFTRLKEPPPEPEEKPTKPKKKKAPAREKEPWKMTRDEWQNAIDANKPETVQTRPTKRDKSEALARVRRLEFLHAGADAPWDPEFREIRRITHRDVVLHAMSEGKPVPQARIDEYKGITIQAKALKALRKSDGATMMEFLESEKWLGPGQAKILFKSMLDHGTIYEIDDVYYPFQLARIQEILEKKGKKPEPAKVEPEPKPVETEKGTTLAPWMTAAPFTEKEISYANMFSFYDINWNDEFAKQVTAIEKEKRDHLEKYGIADLPPNVLESMENYRKAIYNAYKETWANRAYYPPVSVVGPSKFPYHRKDKAMARDKKIMERKQAAKKRLDKDVSGATKGIMPKITIDTHIDVAAHSSKVSFGNQYAKIEMAGKSNMRGFEHVYRKRGRELHRSLVDEAIKQNKKVIWAAVKDYPEFHDYQNIIDRPLKYEMPETQHERIINVKPKGGKPRGYAAFLKMVPGPEYKDARFQWIWGKPIQIPGFEGYQFYVSKYEGKYYVYEASTGKTVSEGRSAMDAAHTNAQKNLEDKTEYFDKAMQQTKKIADYEGMIPIYEDMMAKIPGKPSATAKEPEREVSKEDKILELLEAGEMHIDDIGKQTGMESYQVSASLVMLEIEGRVRQKAGKMFELTTAATSGVMIGV